MLEQQQRVTEINVQQYPGSKTGRGLSTEKKLDTTRNAGTHLSSSPASSRWRPLNPTEMHAEFESPAKVEKKGVRLVNRSPSH